MKQASAKTTIVFYDSDKQFEAALAGYLGEVGFSIECPGDPLAALRIVHESSPDLMIAEGDHSLRSGQTIVSTARRTQQGQELPIIVTGNSPPGEGDAALADYYLRKPFPLSQCVHVIKSMRSNGKLRRLQPGTHIELARGELPERGKLDEVPFHQVFSTYWKGVASGVIALKAGSTLRRVDFCHGFPVAARSNLVTEHLLRYLLRLGFITPEAYRQLLPRAQEQDWDPTEVLVDSGAISRTVLEEAESKLVREIVLQCFKWNSAAFRFSPKIMPAKHRDTVVLNPFEIYIAWLRDPSTSADLGRKVAFMSGRALKATPLLREHYHLLSSYLEMIPSSSSRFDGSSTLSELVEKSGQDEVKSALVAMVELGVLQAVRAEGRSRKRFRTTSIGDSGRKFERIRQMVEEDQGRIVRAKSPYQVLGLAEGSGTTEVTARFQRFSRFYRPENFERIGDDELVSTARELLAAFRNAATEILGKAPAEIPLSQDRKSSPSVSRKISADEQVLADVFFDDGSTYLKLGDIGGALAQFNRSTKLAPDNPRYLAYAGWCTYQANRDNPTGVSEAKQTLLSVLKLDSRNDRALYFLGCLYEDSGRLDRAIDCWKKAVRLNNSNYDAQSALRRVGQ